MKNELSATTLYPAHHLSATEISTLMRHFDRALVTHSSAEAFGVRVEPKVERLLHKLNEILHHPARTREPEPERKCLMPPREFNIDDLVVNGRGGDATRINAVRWDPLRGAWGYKVWGSSFHFPANAFKLITKHTP